uniref:Uncharacterized protein n=1 Tax=Rhizophora mucronata TaxID=61149 RepID=A0A2P2Q8I8_RHIMU
MVRCTIHLTAHIYIYSKSNPLYILKDDHNFLFMCLVLL